MVVSCQRTRDTLVYWQHDGEHGGEIGGCLEENLALVEGLDDELVLLVVELHDGLLEVPYTSMYELGRLRGSSCEEASVMGSQTTEGDMTWQSLEDMEEDLQ